MSEVLNDKLTALEETVAAQAAEIEALKNKSGNSAAFAADEKVELPEPIAFKVDGKSVKFKYRSFVVGETTHTTEQLNDKAAQALCVEIAKAYPGLVEPA